MLRLQGKIGQVGRGVGLRQLAANGQGLLVGLLSLLQPLRVAVEDGQVAQAPGKIGQVGRGVGLRQLAANGQGLLVGLLSLLQPLRVVVELGQVVQGRGDIGQVGRERSPSPAGDRS